MISDDEADRIDRLRDDRDRLLLIADDWSDDKLIWPVCEGWAGLHGIEPRLLAGILEFHGEAAWYPPDDTVITRKVIWQFCAVNYGVYRFNNSPSEDHLLYGMEDDMNM